MNAKHASQAHPQARISILPGVGFGVSSSLVTENYHLQFKLLAVKSIDVPETAHRPARSEANMHSSIFYPVLW